jgi:cyanophycinase-like exopeptidase
MHAGHRADRRLRIERALLGQLVCEHVEQDFGIGVGVDVAAVGFEDLPAQVLGVDQVAVVGQGDLALVRPPDRLRSAPRVLRGAAYRPERASR